ncbi:MAG: dephospho-CoA kinase [Neisseriaceae bacterium]
MKNHIVVGLTGLIGSGKSLVADIFAKCGADIIDTDLISHELTSKGGSAISLISKQLGREFISKTGELNRDKTRDLVFKDDKAKAILENILHELIYDNVVSRLNSANAKIVIIVVPLLFKAQKYLKLIDYSIFIDCDEKLLFKRVKERSNLTDDMIKNILLAQVPREMQLKLADYVIENNSSIENLETSVIYLYNRLLQN